MNTIESRKNNRQLFAATAVGLCLLVFISKKAYYTSFTHDEAYTYLRFVHENFMDIISYKVAFTNNHILNTLLTKYSEILFGSSEFALRLPNIIAFIIYSFFTIRLVLKKAPLVLFPFYLLMVCNPYLLDFFSLCRGYGLSFAFMMMSLYYLIIYFDTKSVKHLTLFNVGVFLAFMSNFSLLNFYLVAVIAFNIVLFIDNKFQLKIKFDFFKTNKTNLFALVFFSAVLYEPIRKISGENMLDFGGKEGFIHDTIGSLIRQSFYEMTVSEAISCIIKVFVLVIAISIFIWLLFKLIKKQTEELMANKALLLVNLILLGITTITLLQHYIIGNDFYTERFALFLYPLFILNLGFFVNAVVVKKRSVSFVSLLMIGICMSFNVYSNWSIKFHKDWKYDADSKMVMQKLADEHKAKADSNKVTLGVNWLLEPSTNFYRYTRNLNWLNPTHRKGLNYREDYFYIFQNDSSFERIKSNNQLLINELSGTVLLRKAN